MLDSEGFFMKLETKVPLIANLATRSPAFADLVNSLQGNPVAAERTGLRAAQNVGRVALVVNDLAIVRNLVAAQGPDSLIAAGIATLGAIGASWGLRVATRELNERAG